MIKNKKSCYYVAIITLGCLATFLHLYRLSSLPAALNVDEAGLWYNVRCLLNWGTDQKGNSWPILFANMWGEQSPGYAYLAFICCKIFGESLFTIRLPAVINTFLVLIFGYKAIDILFKNKKINLLFLVIYTITPYFTIISKMALDCNLMLGFSTMFLYFILKALDTRALKWYFATGIVAGLTFYTYALSYLMIPIFLIFTLIYLICYKKVSVKEVVIFCIPAILLGLPLLIVQLINILDWQELQILGITFTKFESTRNGEFSFSLSNALFNLVCSIIYIFKGLNGSIYNISCGYLLYPTSIFVLLGFIFAVKDFITSIKNKEFQNQNILLFWAIAILFTTSMLNAGRDLYQQCAIYFVYIVFSICSICHFYKMLNTNRAKKIFVILLVLVYIVGFAHFSYVYFVQYDEFASETKLMADVVPEQLHELEGKTYFLKHYVYYQATYCVPPEKFKADDQDPFEYRNIIFNFYLLEDTPIDENCNYVIYYKDLEKIGYLSEYNFDVNRVGNYLFYTSKQ